MDIGVVMNTLRDPAGLPADPALFQGLMLFTWIFHIAFVHLAMGSALLALWAFCRRQHGPHWTRLSMALTKVAKVSVSLLIVLGVAPLLFTQVIYDPQWYASNVLSARWALGFIGSLIVAYCLWFAFYQGNQIGARRRWAVLAAISLGLMAMDGLIMHALSFQALLPEQWMAWYAPGGVVDMRGASLHAIQWPRYVFIMSLSVPAVGLFLLAYSEYFGNRADFAADYLAFVRRLGRRWALWGLVMAMVLFLGWQGMHPAATGLARHPVGWALGATLVALWWAVQRWGSGRHGYQLVAAGLSLLSVLSVWREVIRVVYLRPFGYAIGDATVHMDWPSLGLFAATFLGVGGLVGGFYLLVLYRAGRVQGVYQADSAVSRMGSAAVGVLALWIAVFFAYGITIWVSNAFLV